MPVPSNTAFQTALKNVYKSDKGLSSSGVVDKENGDKIFDLFFAKSETNKDNGGPLEKVPTELHARAWVRILLFYATYTTSQKRINDSNKHTFKVWVSEKKEERIEIDSHALRKIINNNGFTLREYFRRYAYQTIKMIKEHPQWAPRIATKWGVPNEKFYLAIDFADRLSYEEKRDLGITDEDVAVINNATYANTMRSAINDVAKTSTATIYNPGFLNKPVGISRMIGQ